MNKNYGLFCAAALTALPIFAVESVTSNASAPKAPEQGRRVMSREQALRVLGGPIIDTRKQKGEIVFINAQNDANEGWLADGANVIAKELRVAVRVAKGTFDLAKPKLVGNVTVFLVDDPALPMSLVASEAGWSMVNVCPLKSDKGAFYENRVKKAMTRAVVPLLGGADSQYPLCLMGPVKKAEDFDKFINSRLPIDVVDRMHKNMSACGIAPYSFSMYRKACEEGWAPQPTNEYQKIVWDKVHSKPTKPIKITFDPKKGE